MFSYLFDCHRELDTINRTDIEVNTCRTFLRMVMSLDGVKLRNMLPNVVKLLSSGDYVNKSLASWCLCHAAMYDSKNSTIILLAVNTLLQDSAHSNPLIRCLAVRTLTELRTACVAFEFSMTSVNCALNDSNVLVRRAAVVSCLSSTYCALIDQLYSLIRDVDPIACVNCLLVLNKLLDAEGGVVINRQIARFMLQRLSNLPAAQAGITLQILTSRYIATTESEILDTLKLTDVCLQSNNNFVLTQALFFCLHLVNHGSLSHLRSDIIRRTLSSLKSLLRNTDSPETLLSTLEFICEHLLPEFQRVLLPCVDTLSYVGVDPAYVKTAKLRLLHQLTYSSNVSRVLDELCLFATDSSESVFMKAVECIGSTSVYLGGKSVERLLSVWNNSVNNAGRMAVVLCVLHNIDKTSYSCLPQVVDYIAKYMYCELLQQHDCDIGTSAIVTHYRATTATAAVGSVVESAISSCLSILAEHHDDSGIPHLLQCFLEETMASDSLESCQFLVHVLHVVYLLLVYQTTHYQDIIVDVFQHCTSLDHPLLTDQLQFYYQLLFHHQFHHNLLIDTSINLIN